MPDAGFKPHPLFARAYIKGSDGAERRGAAEHRDEVLAGLRGRVLELAAATG